MITVNGNHLRNMPEQISKNTEDILDLQDAANALDGRVTDLENSIISDITLNNLNVTGNTVIGDAGSDTLTVTGASSFAGNVNVTGNVTASGALAAASASFTGNIAAANYNKVENVVKGSQDEASFYANEGDIEFSDNANIDDYFEIGFAHWRVSNGKLSVVVNINTKYDADNSMTIPTMTNESKNYILPLPAWVKNKLLTVPPTDRLCVDQKEMQWNFTGTSQTITPKPKLMMFKNGADVRVAIFISNAAAQTIGATTLYMVRFEENFML